MYCETKEVSNLIISKTFNPEFKLQMIRLFESENYKSDTVR